MIRRSPRPDSGYLQIRNDVLRDQRLSYRARGLLAAMLSYPDNWRFDRDWLAAQSPGEGRDAIGAALQELERAGYLVRTRIRLPNGRFGWEHTLFETSQDETFPQVAPLTENPPVVPPGKTEFPQVAPLTGLPPTVNQSSYEDCSKNNLKISLKPARCVTADRSETAERESLSASPDSKPRRGSAYAALAAVGVTGDEADQVIEWADDEDLGPKGGPKGFAWWKHMARSGDLVDLVDDFRNAAPERRRREPCPEHGVAYGGDHRRTQRSRGVCRECNDQYDDWSYYVTREYDGPPVESGLADTGCGYAVSSNDHWWDN